MSRRLASLQRDFQAYVLEGGGRVVKAIKAESADAAAAGLQVYARAYELRLIEVLRADFPALRKIAGEELFDALARWYIRDHPSRSRNARWFACRFPDFVASRLASLPHPAIAEMARFEWALGLAFDASDEPPLRLDRLAAIRGEELAAASFRLHPSVQRTRLLWNVPALWTALEEDLETPPPLEAAPETVSWIVWRPETTSRFRALEVDESIALDALAAGRSFADACELLGQRIGAAEVPARAAQLMRRWIDEEVIADVTFESRDRSSRGCGAARGD